MGLTNGGQGWVLPSAFPPIADYGFLSDCESMALVALGGGVEWLCLPRLDSPSVFGALLDRHAGSFRLGPTDQRVPTDRRYLPGTMVLETSWGTPTGWLVVRDVLLIGPWHHEQELSRTHRRAPTDYDADHVLLRTVRCVKGEAQVELDCEPMFEYGSVPGQWSYTDRGYYQASVRPVEATAVEFPLALTTDMRLGIEGGRAVARTLLKEGESRFCALSWSEHEPPDTFAEAHDRLVWTAHHWQHWLARGQFPDHRWRTYIERSALTLKGLTFAPTGALVAAPTTSLPEQLGGERNWDYRFSWLRDSAFALWGLHTLGFEWEANDYFWFLADLAERDGDQMQIVYGVDGERQLKERTIEHLAGYEGASPVRAGNEAFDQAQHDVYGAVLDSFYIHTRSVERLNDRIWPILRRNVDSALAAWRRPDRGIWEVRGEPRHFTSSKMMCWVAADRGAKLARIRGEHELADVWRTGADEIHADVCRHGVDERGVFTQEYGGDALDASLLLIPLVGFLPADDERVRATVHAIADDLTNEGLVVRYRPKETDDGLAGEEATFTICSFWLVSALSMIGEPGRAHALCEKLLSFASPLGLYAEELDPLSGRHLGNFPQAFTHLALINAVMQVVGDETRDAASDVAEPPMRFGEGAEAP